jgi:hypothetical protein
MRRYKIDACILLILSVFGFVLAAPVAVQEVREACADAAVDGDENVIIGWGKRADEEEPLLQWWAQAQKGSSSYWSTAPWKYHGSSSAPNYASGTRWDLNPSFSPGGSKPPPLSTSGGTEVPSNPLAEGEAKLIQPGTSTEIQPASLSKAKSGTWAPNNNKPASLSKSKSVSWAPSRTVVLPSGSIHTEMLEPEKKPPQLSITDGTELSLKPEAEAKLIQPETSTDIQPLLQSESPEREGYLPKMAAQQSPPKPKAKNIFKKLLGKLKFKLSRRISRTAGGVVTEG